MKKSQVKMHLLLLLCVVSVTLVLAGCEGLEESEAMQKAGAVLEHPTTKAVAQTIDSGVGLLGLPPLASGFLEIMGMLYTLILGGKGTKRAATPLINKLKSSPEGKLLG